MAPMGAAESGEGRWGLSLPWWSLAIGVLTTAFLVGLAVALLVMHALTYGFTSVAGLGSVDEPDVDRYELALAVGIGTNVFGALGLSRLALRTRAAAWPRVRWPQPGCSQSWGSTPCCSSTASDIDAPTASALGVDVLGAVSSPALVAAGGAPVTTAADDGDDEAGHHAEEEEWKRGHIAEEQHRVRGGRGAAEAETRALPRGVVVRERQVQHEHEDGWDDPEQAEGDDVRANAAWLHTSTLAHDRRPRIVAPSQRRRLPPRVEDAAVRIRSYGDVMATHWALGCVA